MDDNNLHVLDKLNEGATMGMDAISFVSEKVDDPKFKDILNTEYNKYNKISKKINNTYSNYNNGEPLKTSKMNKMMTWYGIQMNTIKNQSNSKISEILMQGTNMGIIEGRKLLNQNTGLTADVKNILNEFIRMQEDSIETLKKHL